MAGERVLPDNLPDGMMDDILTNLLPRLRILCTSQIEQPLRQQIHSLGHAAFNHQMMRLIKDLSRIVLELASPG